MMAASTAAAGATGIRAWLAAKRFAWLTPRRMRLMTIGLIATGLIVSSVGFSSA
jgi:hypothetical protein